MKAFLGLSADFIDRMANPVYGAGVNQAYASRFADLLRRDERLPAQLSADDLSEVDTDLLSMQSWIWYLKWLTKQQELPRDEFLDALYEDAGDSLLRLIIFESVMTNPVVVRRYSNIHEQWAVPLEELPPCWPRNLVLHLVSAEPAGARDIESRPTEQLPEVLELAFSLLQVGNAAALAMLRGLLAYQWPMRGELISLVDTALLQSSGLEASELDQWRRRLGLL
ncbi:hypothetical protein [Streptomyces sp. 1331.2]|uniref:hypothetical protein n=1 Tax=Streptomyces sp. 1331.2 TaxID=1938835 RepID=UPI000BCD698F|nr:hypothetical protein [Streptomyces sp. 1331.2]SOB81373.1 hypothetical protein SAMN06272789_1505 [Streptomyces sp. 1331.2]